MWWYYDGKVELDDGSLLSVKSTYTREEALEVFADWPSGAPKYFEGVKGEERK